jgi:hypothetical protein
VDLPLRRRPLILALNIVTQQRLSEPTWKAEITKMRGFGALLKAAQVRAVEPQRR